MKETLRFKVGEAASGERLDDFLAARLSALSRMKIAALLSAGACTVDGARAAAGLKLAAGAVVEFRSGGEIASSMTPEPLNLEIVYEDEHLVVVNKPAGTLVHPTRGVKSGTLLNGLVRHLNFERFRGANAGRGASEDASENDDAAAPISTFIRPGLVHRLDRATSGLMVVAKTQDALSSLSRHFHRRLVEKRYLALVSGRPQEDEISIDAPIGRDALARPQWRTMEEGKPALTRLRVVEPGVRLSLVELEPVTGRTNQLRIHCAHAGHPIAGDDWYGGPPAPRLCLHAARLAFHHPAGNEWMEFDSSLPGEILCLLEARAS